LPSVRRDVGLRAV